VTSTPEHIEGCLDAEELRAWCMTRAGSVAYDRRHYDNRTFTRCESSTFLWRAARLAAAVRRGMVAGWIEPAEGARLMACVYGLPLDRIY